jgi:erythromycin esterase
MRTRKLCKAFFVAVILCNPIWAVGQSASLGAGSNQTDLPGKGVAKVPVESVRNWLSHAAVPLKTVAPAGSFDDLQPLKKVLRNVRVVGLGEATHGTREFFQFKHRMLEFLVKELGFTVFAIEASYPECLTLNELVLRGKDDAEIEKALRANLALIWQTEEVLGMVKWMRDYNKTVPDTRKVKFMGFDVQRPTRALEIVLAYLQRLAPEYAATVKSVFSLANPGAPGTNTGYEAFKAYQKYTREEKAQIRARLLEVAGFLSFNETRFTRQTSPADFNLALECARILLQGHDVRVASAEPDALDDPGNRDLYMAETVEYILNQEPPGARIVVWAHNGHLSGTLGGAKRMGSYFREVYGNAYYVFAFAFDYGSFQAGDIDAEEAIEHEGLTEFTLGPSPEGSLGWYLSRAHGGNLVVDLHSAPGGAVSEWLQTPISMRIIGAGFSWKWSEKEFTLPTKLKDEYDGLIFIEKTSRARPLAHAKYASERTVELTPMVQGENAVKLYALNAR